MCKAKSFICIKGETEPRRRPLYQLRSEAGGPKLESVGGDLSINSEGKLIAPRLKKVNGKAYKV